VLVASRQPLPLALLPWPELRGRASVVLKLSFDLKRGGNAVRSERPDPLTPDTWSPAGVLLFPSDFVRLKTRCDVLVVGRALTLPPGPATLKATGLLKAVLHVAALGPTTMSSTTPVVQHAPADQSLLPPRLPLRLRYERAQTVIDAFIPGPLPELAILRWGKLEMLRGIVDTLALDPERNRVTLSLRATFDGFDLSEALLVVDEQANLLESFSQQGASWPRNPAMIVSEASLTANPASHHAASTSEPPTSYHLPPPSQAAPARFRAASKTLIHREKPAFIDEPTAVPPARKKSTTLWEEEETTVDGVVPRQTIIADTADNADTAERTDTAEAPPSESNQRGTLPFVRASTTTMPVIAVKPPSQIWGAPQAAKPPTIAMVRTTAKTIAAAPLTRAKAQTLPFLRQPSVAPMAPEEMTHVGEPSAGVAALPFLKSTPPTPPEPPTFRATPREAEAQAAFADEGTADISQSDVSLPGILPQSWAAPKAPPEPRPIPEDAPPATPFERNRNAASVPPRAPPAAVPPAAAPLGRFPLVSGPSPAGGGFDLKPMAQAPASAASKLSVPELSLERYAAIRAEIWSKKEPRGAVLKRHGLSELKWRMAERTLSDRLAGEKLGSAVAATLSTLPSH